jgi:hypothetical protein
VIPRKESNASITDPNQGEFCLLWPSKGLAAKQKALDLEIRLPR